MLQGLILITGEPGVGKTTLIQRVYWDFKTKVKIGGILTREALEGKTRIGFRIFDIASGREGWLARTNLASGPRIGKYTVHVRDLDDIGARALESAATDESVGLVLLDEIGPMEMASERFRNIVTTLLGQRRKPTIATIKLGSDYPEVESALKGKSATWFEVKIDNREIVREEVTGLLDGWLVGARKT